MPLSALSQSCKPLVTERLCPLTERESENKSAAPRARRGLPPSWAVKREKECDRFITRKGSFRNSPENEGAERRVSTLSASNYIPLANPANWSRQRLECGSFPPLFFYPALKRSFVL